MRRAAAAAMHEILGLGIIIFLVLERTQAAAAGGLWRGSVHYGASRGVAAIPIKESSGARVIAFPLERMSRSAPPVAPTTQPGAPVQRTQRSRSRGWPRSATDVIPMFAKIRPSAPCRCRGTKVPSSPHAPAAAPRRRGFAPEEGSGTDAKLLIAVGGAPDAQPAPWCGDGAPCVPGACTHPFPHAPFIRPLQAWRPRMRHHRRDQGAVRFRSGHCTGARPRRARARARVTRNALGTVEVTDAQVLRVAAVRLAWGHRGSSGAQDQTWRSAKRRSAVRPVSCSLPSMGWQGIGGDPMTR